MSVSLSVSSSRYGILCYTTAPLVYKIQSDFCIICILNLYVIMSMISLEVFVAMISFPWVCLSACHVQICSFLSVVCLSYGFHVLTTFVVNKRIYYTGILLYPTDLKWFHVFDCWSSSVVISASVIILYFSGPVRLRGCKNRSAPFPGRMSSRRLNQALYVLSLGLDFFWMCLLCC